MSKIPFSPAEPLAALRHLVLRHQPSGHARMTEPTYTAKYLRVHEPITDAELAAHLAGDITLAAVLQHDNLAFVAACDIDEGGEAMVRRVMRAAETRACHAYGFVLDSGGHSGGHVWIFFEHAHTARDLQVLIRDIVSEAQCPTTEIYPNGADLRLPFGLHRRCHRRGTLLLNSAATPLDLDTDLTDALATFLAEVRLTSDLPVRVAQDAQQARRRAVAEAIATARPRRCDGDAHWREVIANFNQSTDLVSLLERYGAQAVYHYSGGKTLLHCAASQDHAHGDTHPSLVVEPGRGHQIGKMICGCYCPTCRLHNQPGQVMDAFEVFCRLEGISKREGVQRIQATGSNQQDVTPSARRSPTTSYYPDATRPSPATNHRPAPTDTATPDHIAQRRLVELHADRRAQPLDRRLLAYVISHGAQGQGLANATLAAALGARPDSIKRAKRRLRELGYIDVTISTDGIHSSTITIIAPDSPVSCPLSPVSQEGGVQDAPPSHVSESTCVDATPPPESEEIPEAEVPSVRIECSEVQLRRRRSVLLNMIRAGVPERRRLAFTAELASIEEKLKATVLPTTDSQPLTTDQGAIYEPTTDHRLPTINHHLELAPPDDPHPALTDAQLTALLRDVLQDCLASAVRPLLERVSWRLEGDRVELVCEACDLAPVTGHLVGPSRLALGDLELPGVSSGVAVQIGTPAPVDVRPMWLDDVVWIRVPVWARSLLVGSVLADGKLYGATQEQTRAIVAQSEIMAWLLSQVAHVSRDTAIQS